MKRRKSAFILLAISLIIFGLNLNLTGNIIGSNKFGFSLSSILSLGLLIASFILFSTSKTLDVLIVPTGQKKENLSRAKKAAEEWNKHYINKIMISGEREEPLGDSERAEIYKELRKGGIKPKNILLSKGKNSVENILESFKKLEGVKKIGIVSYPEHLNRFEYILERAKDEGLIDEKVKLTKIPTSQSLKEWVYGKLANVKEHYNLRRGIREPKSNQEEGVIMKYLKKIISG